MPESNQRGALTEAVYYILLVLQRPLHGYGMMQEIDRLTQGRVQLGPGTLYGALTTLNQKGWIRQSDQVQGKGKKEYILTQEGVAVLAEEIRRLQELLECAKIYEEKIR
ncbi:Transcriptional regulator, PadR family [Streptococcus sp. DD10]|uniref:PadR family transcriptional regulator n=1 Tax=Streptococcus sp. DD10 TaxID=1777878 RepID=UPI00079692AA|nr:PadR family transcriptional regulator [Streptococcus sp. DD10]KXT74016.1 Transcriptional regulator, PadR family [Streptococcus sp. DD10]